MTYRHLLPYVPSTRAICPRQLATPTEAQVRALAIARAHRCFRYRRRRVRSFVAMENGSAEPAPRLCHVVKVDTFDGYGFNLLAEQGKPGQFIGKVDPGSPAEVAGLKQGDKILEVNGASIANDNHKQVVQKIKAVSGETKLLVITPVGEKIPIPKQEPVEKNGKKIDDDNHTQVKAAQEPAKLNLGMTAAEMRAQLAAKKKNDPKKAPMDFKSKFEIVKKL